MIDFAYARLGLRYNPFGELDRQQRIDSAVPRCEFDSIIPFLEKPSPARTAVQFIGPRGSGKSTHLLLLATTLPGARYTHLPLGGSRAIHGQNFLMIDEAQRLGWHQRRHLFRAARRIVLGTHRCFAWQLRRYGFDTMTVSLGSLPELAWLTRVLQGKIRMAARNAENPLRLDPQTVVKLRDEFGNNIRGMERRLYDTLHALNSAEQVAGAANCRRSCELNEQV